MKNPLGVLVIEKANPGQEETFGGDEHAHYHACGDGFMVSYPCQNLANYALYVCAMYCLSVIP